MADTPPIPLLNSSLAETPTLARSRRRSIRRPTWAGSGFRHDIGAAFSPHYHPQLDAIDHLRSEEHTSELQSRLHLVCRLLLEKKKTITNRVTYGILLVCHFSTS